MHLSPDNSWPFVISRLDESNIYNSHLLTNAKSYLNIFAISHDLEDHSFYRVSALSGNGNLKDFFQKNIGYARRPCVLAVLWRNEVRRGHLPPVIHNKWTSKLQSRHDTCSKPGFQFPKKSIVPAFKTNIQKNGKVPCRIPSCGF